MKTRTISRAVTMGLTGSVVAALAVVGATGASAATDQYAPSIGTVVGTAMTGAVGVPGGIITSAPCPADTTSVNGFWNSTAAGIVDGVIISTNSTDIATINTSGMPLNSNFAVMAQDAGKTLVNGSYDISIVCYPDPFSTPTAQFDGTLVVSGGATPTSLGTTYTWQAAAAPASTTTLAVAPASPQDAGTSITLTATVAGPAAVSTAGAVQFMDGASALGAPVATAGGVAAVSTAALSVGTHSLTAVFTPASAAVLAGSTSSAVSFVINAAPVTTTTTLASSPAAPTTADAITLTASVSPAGATGSVTFTEGATTVGTAAVTGGSASVSLTGVAAGAHTYTAALTGTGVYQNSSASAITVTVTAYAGAMTAETIITTIPAGTLTISAATTPVQLGTAALNATNTLYVAGPTPINDVTVTDTRAGSLGWDCNGQVGNFSGAVASPTHVINGQNLGWATRLVSIPASMQVVAGPSVSPASGVGVSDPGTQGLKSSRLLAHANAGNSVGTAVLGADLTLNAPTTTPADTYTATLTLTAI